MSTHEAELRPTQPATNAETPTIRVSVDLPRELRDIVGSPEELARRARRSLVLDLLREGEISQGKAARLLGITRWDLLDVMARYHIPSGPLTPEELERDLEAALQGALPRPLHAGG